MVRRRATPSASPTPPVRLVPEVGTCEPFPAAVRKMFALAAMVSRSWFCWALIPYTTIRVNPNFDHHPPLIFSSLEYLSANPLPVLGTNVGRSTVL